MRKQSFQVIIFPFSMNHDIGQNPEFGIYINIVMNKNTRFQVDVETTSKVNQNFNLVSPPSIVLRGLKFLINHTRS